MKFLGKSKKVAGCVNIFIVSVGFTGHRWAI